MNWERDWVLGAGSCLRRNDGYILRWYDEGGGAADEGAAEG